MVVLNTSQAVAVSTQEGLSLALPLNLHHLLPDDAPFWQGLELRMISKRFLPPAIGGTVIRRFGFFLKTLCFIPF